VTAGSPADGSGGQRASQLPAEPASSRAAATLSSRRANGAQPAHRAALAGKAAC